MPGTRTLPSAEVGRLDCFSNCVPLSVSPPSPGIVDAERQQSHAELEPAAADAGVRQVGQLHLACPSCPAVVDSVPIAVCRCGEREKLNGSVR